MKPLGLMVLLLLAGGCGQADGDARGFAGTTDTLPNGAVLVRNPAVGLWSEGEEWKLTEEVRIGSADAEGPELLAEVGGILVDSLGRIYVLERQAKEVRVFDSREAHVRTFGREGGGPGEFRDPIGIFSDTAGRIWVTDPGNARYAVFDTAGTYVNSYRRSRAGYTIPWQGGFDGEGRLVEVTTISTSSGPKQAVVRTNLDAPTTMPQTLQLPEYEGEAYELVTSGSFVSVRVPFTPYLTFQLDPPNLWVGVNDRYRIVKQTLDGDTLLVIEREEEAVPVTASERATALEELEPLRRQGLEVDEGRVSSVKPPYDAFWVDEDGRLWVVPARRGGEGFGYHVFDPEGRYLGVVSTPVSFGFPAPVFHGDCVYGIHYGQLGIPYVVVLRIAR
jgi:sugar lactone lactonase YvrE